MINTIPAIVQVHVEQPILMLFKERQILIASCMVVSHIKRQSKHRALQQDFNCLKLIIFPAICILYGNTHLIPCVLLAHRAKIKHALLKLLRVFLINIMLTRWQSNNVTSWNVHVDNRNAHLFGKSKPFQHGLNVSLANMGIKIERVKTVIQM